MREETIQIREEIKQMPPPEKKEEKEINKTKRQFFEKNKEIWIKFQLHSPGRERGY